MLVLLPVETNEVLQLKHRYAGIMLNCNHICIVLRGSFVSAIYIVFNIYYIIHNTYYINNIYNFDTII